MEGPGVQSFLLYPYFLIDHCKYPDHLSVPPEQLGTYSRVRGLAVALLCHKLGPDRSSINVLLSLLKTSPLDFEIPYISSEVTTRP
jgi:hypothetical protein